MEPTKTSHNHPKSAGTSQRHREPLQTFQNRLTSQSTKTNFRNVLQLTKSLKIQNRIKIVFSTQKDSN